MPTRKIASNARKITWWAFVGFVVVMLCALVLEPRGNIEINAGGYGKLIWVVWVFIVGISASIFKTFRTDGLKTAILLALGAAMLMASALFRGLPIASTYVYATPQGKSYYAYQVSRKKPSPRSKTRLIQDAMGIGGVWYRVVVRKDRVDARELHGLLAGSTKLYVRDPNGLPVIGGGGYWSDPKPAVIHGYGNWFVFRMKALGVVN